MLGEFCHLSALETNMLLERYPLNQTAPGKVSIPNFVGSLHKHAPGKVPFMSNCSWKGAHSKFLSALQTNMLLQRCPLSQTAPGKVRDFRRVVLFEPKCTRKGAF